MKTRSLVSFDWAMKRLLRNKANFEVLEGFLSELLRRDIVIKKILESESNKEDKEDKYNRVDILVEADDSELVIIELQHDSENDYFQRMLYGVSKAVIEYIYEKEAYSTIRKVYSINIVYFDLGEGDDYIYHGFTNFRGFRTNTELKLTKKQRRLYGKTYPGELNPEYYLLKVKNFDDAAKDTLDEWIYFLKNSDVKDGFTAKGLEKAKEVMDFHKLTPEEQADYKRSIENNRIINSVMNTAFTDGEIIGLEKGEAIGVQKGLEKGEAIGVQKEKKETIAKLLKAGHSTEIMAVATGLSQQQVQEIISTLQQENNPGPHP
jgi:predicted transposase/invertase (TIGR01784 family)